jgi:hypothetical protein
MKPIDAALPPPTTPPAPLHATPDTPCDFLAFLSERRGIGVEEAERMIATWLATYRPLRRWPIDSLRGREAA